MQERGRRVVGAEFIYGGVSFFRLRSRQASLYLLGAQKMTIDPNFMCDAYDDLATPPTPAERRARADSNLGRDDSYAAIPLPKWAPVYTSAAVIADPAAEALIACMYVCMTRTMAAAWPSPVQAPYRAVPGARNAMRRDLHATGVIS